MVSIKAILPAALLALDQSLKYLALNTPFSTLTYNTGIALGLFQGANTIMILVSFIALGAIAYSYKRLSKIEQTVMLIISAGVVGNLIDRILIGAVVDYIKIPLFAPVFNVADVCITGGVIFLLILPLFQNSSKSSSSSK